MLAARPTRRALYLQVRDALADRIARGEWAPGALVPNESDLARDFGVSAGTMRKALNLLEADRLITRRQGKGTFVNDQACEQSARRLIRIRAVDGSTISSELRSQVISEDAAGTLDCDRLCLRAGDRVYRIRQTKDYVGRSFLVTDITLPAALYPRLAEACSVPERLSALAPWNGLLLGKAEERISLRVPPPDVRELLGIDPDTAVMHLERTLFLLGSERPAAWRTAYCRLPDGAYYAAELG